MKLISELVETDVKTSIIDIVLGDVSNIQILKIIGMGELNGGGADSRLTTKVNNLSGGYRSYVNAGGDYANGEWGSQDSLYIGRSGWHLDVTFSFEQTLTFIAGGQRINSLSASTFAHADSRLIGYEGHGYASLQNPVSQFSLNISAGIMRHRTRIYVL